jgi:hypothetical protein
MWVDSAVLTFGRSLPVYPDEPTFSESVGMSQKCQKLTSSVGILLSAPTGADESGNGSRQASE